MASRGRQEREWAKLLEAYRIGDESQERFCRRRRLNVWTFRSRLYKKRGNAGTDQSSGAEPAVRFVEVRPQPAELGSGRCRIRFGATTLELDALPPAEWVVALASGYRE